MISRRALLVGGGAAVVAAGVGGGVAAEWDNPRFVRLRGGCGSTPAIPPSTYTVTRGTFASRAMKGTVPWAVAKPASSANPDSEAPSLTRPAVVLCLPGLGDGIESVFSNVGFTGYASAAKLNLAFAVPGGGGDLYWHPRADGRDPLAWARDEFLPMVEERFAVGRSSGRAVIGWSMGGYGALLVAQQSPGLMSGVAALSPAVYPSYDAARSGHPYTFDSESDWERYGLWTHLSDIDGTRVRIDCGDADPFAPTARQLLQRIPGATGSIAGGCHDAGFWRRSAPDALRFLATGVGRS